MRLGMGTQLGTCRRQQRCHGIQIVFESIQINHQRGGINILLTHAGFGGWVLQHGVSSVSRRHLSHGHAFRANPR